MISRNRHFEVYTNYEEKDAEGRHLILPSEYAEGYAQTLIGPRYTYLNDFNQKVLGELLLAGQMPISELTKAIAEREQTRPDKSLRAQIHYSRRRIEAAVPGIIACDESNHRDFQLKIDLEVLKKVALDEEGEKTAHNCAANLGSERINALVKMRRTEELVRLIREFDLNERESYLLSMILRGTGYHPNKYCIKGGFFEKSEKDARALATKLGEEIIYERDGTYYPSAEIINKYGATVYSHPERLALMEARHANYPLPILDNIREKKVETVEITPVSIDQLVTKAKELSHKELTVDVDPGLRKLFILIMDSIEEEYAGTTFIAPEALKKAIKEPNHNPRYKEILKANRHISGHTIKALMDWITAKGLELMYENDLVALKNKILDSTRTNPPPAEWDTSFFELKSRAFTRTSKPQRWFLKNVLPEMPEEWQENFTGSIHLSYEARERENINYKQRAVPIRRHALDMPDEIIESFLKKKYGLLEAKARKLTDNSQHIKELHAVGIIGLMEALERFDEKFGIKFDTYSIWWIRSSMTEHRRNVLKAVRITNTANEDILKINKTRHGLRVKYGSDPSDEEIAQEVGITVARYRDICNLNQTICLDAPTNTTIGSKKEITLGERILFEEGETADTGLLMQAVMKHWDELEPIEREILVKRFGLNGNDELINSEIGKEVGYSREKIRQLLNGALKKLRKALETKVD